MVEIDAETRAAAQEAIGEGGYYSVEETAKRILDFAVAISGGDPSKIDVLERAAMRGFQAAERMWGRELPEITRQTMDAVREGFEQWRQAGSASAISLLQ
jgi:ribosome modulation factor